MKTRSRNLLRTSNCQQDLKNNLQPLLAVSLLFIGLGNISIPGSWPVVSSVYLPIALLAVFVVVFLNLKWVIYSLRSVVLLSLLIASFSMGYFITPLNPYGETKLVAFVLSLLLLTAPAAFRNPKINVQLMVKVIMVLAATTSILLLIVGEPDVAGRLTLFGINPISTGRVTGIGVLIALVYLISFPKKNRLVVLILIILVVPCLIATALTGSRGPLVAIIGGVITSVMVGWRRDPKRSFFVLVGLLGVGGYVSTLSFENSDLRIISTDSTGRDVLFEAAFSTMAKIPVGLGWGNFHEVLPGQRGVNSYTLYPHNIFLEVGVEGGWLALVIFTLLVIAALMNAFRSARQGKFVSVCLLSLLVFAVVNACFSSDLVGNRMVWLFLGLCLLPLDSVNPDVKNSTTDDTIATKNKEKVIGTQCRD